MTPETVTTIGQQALWVTMMLAAPPLLSALAVGLLVGMFQAATQINEMTMSFIPKLIVLALALIIAGPWMLSVITSYTIQLIQQIPSLIS
jgi:flagellar biosynthetic protein FliQ